jgi:hypothetical protein
MNKRQNREGRTQLHLANARVHEPHTHRRPQERRKTPHHTYCVSSWAPSNEYRRMQDLLVALKKAGLPWPPPSKKEQRAQRKKGDES